MKTNMFLKLNELTEIAAQLNRHLLLEDRIILVAYGDNGKVKSTHQYDYTETDIQHLAERLNTIAKKQRKQWEPEFMRFMSSVTSLGWTITFNELAATLYSKANNISYSFTYDEFGLNDMGDLLTSTLLAQHAPVSVATSENTPEKPHSSQTHGYSGHCGGNCGKCHNTESSTEAGQGIKKECQSCGNDRCGKNPNLIILLWEQLDHDQQNLLYLGLPSEKQAELMETLGKSQQSEQGTSPN